MLTFDVHIVHCQSSVVQYNEYYQLMTLNLEMEYLKEKFEIWK